MAHVPQEARRPVLGRVVVSRPYELLDVEHDGFVSQGRDDTDSEAAREHRGTHDT